MKGTLSEAELHLLQQRMEQGRLNKARRGELFNHPPIGYIRGGDGQLQIDPDQQVQSVVRLVFDKFEELGSVNALLRYLVRHEVRLGVRAHSGGERGELRWRRPYRVALGNMLSHPLYAGAYTWGRRPTNRRRRTASGRAVKDKLLAARDCAVFIKDRCPAYITWERHEANLRQLAHNRSRMDARGAVREGPALLKGLLVCGKCGCRIPHCIVGCDETGFTPGSCPARKDIGSSGLMQRNWSGSSSCEAATVIGLTNLRQRSYASRRRCVGAFPPGSSGRFHAAGHACPGCGIR